jgi:hypothetical protein
VASFNASQLLSVRVYSWAEGAPLLLKSSSRSSLLVSVVNLFIGRAAGMAKINWFHMAGGPMGVNDTLGLLGCRFKALSGKIEQAMDVSTSASAECTAPTSATTFKSIFLGNKKASMRFLMGFGLLGNTMGKSFSI